MLDPEKLNALFGMLKELHLIYEPRELWEAVLNRSCQLLRAEGGSFFLVSSDGRMELAAAVGVDEEQLRRVPMRVGAGICGWAAENRQSVLVDDARSDSRFNPMADQITGATTRSLLCIPIFSQKATYGVLELVNRTEGSFTAEDEEFMTVLGGQTAVVYQNLLLMRETSQTKVLLESLLVNMSGGLIATDASGNVTIFNPSAQVLLGLSAQKVVGKPAAAVLMDYPLLLAFLHVTLANGTTVSRQETMLTVDGQSCRFGYSTILIADPDQRILGSGVIFQKLS